METHRESVDPVADDVIKSFARAAVLAALLGRRRSSPFRFRSHRSRLRFRPCSSSWRDCTWGPSGEPFRSCSISPRERSVSRLLGMTGGLGVLVGETGGYLWAYAIAAGVVGLIVHRGGSSATRPRNHSRFSSGVWSSPRCSSTRSEPATWPGCSNSNSEKPSPWASSRSFPVECSSSSPRSLSSRANGSHRSDSPADDRVSFRLVRLRGRSGSRSCRCRSATASSSSSPVPAGAGRRPSFATATGCSRPTRERFSSTTVRSVTT